jgi:pimeloyl-ACP methyl ester carboxylesterase
MRDLNKHLAVVKNPRTGDALEYAVVGDAARSGDVIVFFPGTGQTIADWPTQLLTNSVYSPKIAGTIGYRRDQNGPDSLCHDFRLVFFDYPGVGLTAYRPNAGHDAIASDVDAMLQEIGKRYAVPTDNVSLLGWSLGTAFALKYAYLSPVSRPQRKIRNVLLLAAGPGGSLQGQVGADNASCVTTLFKAAETAKGTLAKQIRKDATELLFPYVGQKPDNNGTNSDCKATVTNQIVMLSVTTHCTVANGCQGFLENATAALYTFPWHRTEGVSGNTYVEQRYQDNDFTVAYCGKAAPGFKSEDCVAYNKIEQSITDGGMCKTDTSNPDKPVSRDCARLHLTGKVVILDDYEDIFTQWTYDRALAIGLNLAEPGSASFTPCPFPGSHGFFIENPRWVQAKFAAAMQ